MTVGERNEPSLCRPLLTEHASVYLPRPLAVAGSGVARIFVLTGPAYNEPVVPLAVEADLILSGNPPFLTPFIPLS